MARPVLLAAAVLVLGVQPAAAHDLGVAKVRLDQTGETTYSLSVAASPTMRGAYRDPVLPERARRVDLETGASGSSRLGQLRWDFTTGDGPLVAGDVLHLPWDREGAMVTARWLDGSEARFFFAKGDAGTDVELAYLKAGSGSFAETVRRYTVLGIEHILLGFDHLLFVLGLLFLVAGGWQLAKTITAFTVAHSITLGLATLGFLDVPAKAVDAIVALSIVFLGVEILEKQRGRETLAARYPWAVAFGFGLVHGLGFAGALNALGLPEREIPPALLFFNVGVEIGQLLFVLCFLVLSWALARLEVVLPRWMRPIPAYAIGIVATWWLVDRATLLFSAGAA